MAGVELRGVSKIFPGGIEAVATTDLRIDDGELFAIVGPSGSGKSTLLRLISGLETLSAGTLWIGEDRADRLAPCDRDLALVSQNPALFPFLSVADNLAFGLRARRRPAQDVRERVEAVAAQLGLTGLLGRSPSALSGGQRQRTALGRAIARRPRVFLFDEPFSGLDAPLRSALRAELLDLHGQLGTTMILVTHDQGEALTLGQRLAVMDRGRVVQTGPPIEIYDRPATRFVAEFFGSPPMTFLPCEVDSQGERLWVRSGKSTWAVPADDGWAEPLRRRGPGRADLGLRPEHVEVREPQEIPGEPIGPARWQVEAQIHRLEPLGHETIASLTVGSHSLKARLPARTRFRVGDHVLARFDPASASWFDSETGSAL